LFRFSVYTPRLLGASFLGYPGRGVANSFVLAKNENILLKDVGLCHGLSVPTVIGQAFGYGIFIVGAYVGAAFFTPWMILWAWIARYLSSGFQRRSPYVIVII